MRKYIMLFVLTFVCQDIEDNRFGPVFMRCENDEVVCYVFEDYKAGGISCKFKEEQ